MEKINKEKATNTIEIPTEASPPLVFLFPFFFFYVFNYFQENWHVKTKKEQNIFFLFAFYFTKNKNH